MIWKCVYPGPEKHWRKKKERKRKNQSVKKKISTEIITI